MKNLICENVHCTGIAAYWSMLIIYLQDIHGHPSGKKKRLWLQPSKKQGCNAKLHIREVTLFPEMDILEKIVGKSSFQVRLNKIQ